MTKKPQAPQLPKELSRKYISRAERDARRTRILVLAVGGAVLVSILLIGFAVFREAVLLPNEPVAIVGDQQILTREFQQRVRLTRMRMIQQYEAFQGFGLQDNALQVLQQLSDPVGLGSQVIISLVNEALYRQAAPELGVTVTADEVQTAIEEGFGYFRVTPTPLPTSTPRPTPTPNPSVTPAPTSTPFPTATPITAEGFAQLYQGQIGELAALGYSEADYRRLVETQLIAQKVQEIVVSDVVSVTEQTTFQYIRAASQADIDAAQQAVEQDGFDVVYGQVLSQTFPITTLIAVEYPFIPAEELAALPQFGPRFADAVFATPISGTFSVITSTDGSLYYVGLVLNREARELDPSTLQDRQSRKLDSWLAGRNALLSVQVLTWEDRVPTDPSP
jgi:hypothetical protein